MSPLSMDDRAAEDSETTALLSQAQTNDPPRQIDDPGSDTADRRPHYVQQHTPRKNSSRSKLGAKSGDFTPLPMLLTSLYQWIARLFKPTKIMVYGIVTLLWFLSMTFLIASTSTDSDLISGDVILYFDMVLGSAALVIGSLGMVHLYHFQRKYGFHRKFSTYLTAMTLHDIEIRLLVIIVLWMMVLSITWDFVVRDLATLIHSSTTLIPAHTALWTLAKLSMGGLVFMSLWFPWTRKCLQADKKSHEWNMMEFLYVMSLFVVCIDLVNVFYVLPHRKVLFPANISSVSTSINSQFGIGSNNHSKADNQTYRDLFSLYPMVAAFDVELVVSFVVMLVVMRKRYDRSSEVRSRPNNVALPWWKRPLAMGILFIVIAFVFPYLLSYPLSLKIEPSIAPTTILLFLQIVGTSIMCYLTYVLVGKFRAPHFHSPEVLLTFPALILVSLYNTASVFRISFGADNEDPDTPSALSATFRFAELVGLLAQTFCTWSLLRARIVGSSLDYSCDTFSVKFRDRARKLFAAAAGINFLQWLFNARFEAYHLEEASRALNHTLPVNDSLHESLFSAMGKLAVSTSLHSVKGSDGDTPVFGTLWYSVQYWSAPWLVELYLILAVLNFTNFQMIMQLSRIEEPVKTLGWFVDTQLRHIQSTCSTIVSDGLNDIWGLAGRPTNVVRLVESGADTVLCKLMDTAASEVANEAPIEAGNRTFEDKFPVRELLGATSALLKNGTARETAKKYFGGTKAFLDRVLTLAGADNKHLDLVFLIAGRFVGNGQWATAREDRTSADLEAVSKWALRKRNDGHTPPGIGLNDYNTSPLFSALRELENDRSVDSSSGIHADHSVHSLSELNADRCVHSLSVLLRKVFWYLRLNKSEKYTALIEKVSKRHMNALLANILKSVRIVDNCRRRELLCLLSEWMHMSKFQHNSKHAVRRVEMLQSRMYSLDVDIDSKALIAEVLARYYDGFGDQTNENEDYVQALFDMLLCRDGYVVERAAMGLSSLMVFDRSIAECIYNNRRSLARVLEDQAADKTNSKVGFYLTTFLANFAEAAKERLADILERRVALMAIVSLIKLTGLSLWKNISQRDSLPVEKLTRTLFLGCAQCEDFWKNVSDRDILPALVPLFMGSDLQKMNGGDGRQPCNLQEDVEHLLQVLVPLARNHLDIDMNRRRPKPTVVTMNLTRSLLCILDHSRRVRRRWPDLEERAVKAICEESEDSDGAGPSDPTRMNYMQTILLATTKYDDGVFQETVCMTAVHLSFWKQFTRFASYKKMARGTAVQMIERILRENSPTKDENFLIVYWGKALGHVERDARVGGDEELSQLVHNVVKSINTMTPTEKGRAIQRG